MPPAQRRYRFTWLGRILFVVLVIALGVFVTALVVKLQHDRLLATSDAKHYTPPTFSAPVRSQSVLSIIGDGYTVAPSSGSTGIAPTPSTTAAPAVTWPNLVATKFSAQAFLQPAVGGGYIKVATANGQTYGDLATQISPGARAVVFFGARGDSGANAFSLTQAAASAFAEAARIAPNARVYVIGPVYPPDEANDSLESVSTAIKKAAVIANVKYVDPMTAGWFPDDSDFTPSGEHLSTKGQNIAAKKMESLLGKAFAKS